MSNQGPKVDDHGISVDTKKDPVNALKLDKVGNDASTLSTSVDLPNSTKSLPDNALLGTWDAGNGVVNVTAGMARANPKGLESREVSPGTLPAPSEGQVAKLPSGSLPPSIKDTDRTNRPVFTTNSSGNLIPVLPRTDKQLRRD